MNYSKTYCPACGLEWTKHTSPCAGNDRVYQPPPPTDKERILQLEAEIAALKAKHEAAIAEAVRAEREREWDGKERRCDHDMKWIIDWYGDPGVVNGTADCSRLECKECGWVDPNGEPPDDYPDEP